MLVVVFRRRLHLRGGRPALQRGGGGVGRSSRRLASPLTSSLRAVRCYLIAREEEEG